MREGCKCDLCCHTEKKIILTYLGSWWAAERRGEGFEDAGVIVGYSLRRMPCCRVRAAIGRFHELLKFKV